MTDRDDNTGKVKANVTFHRQILDLVERSGRTGITLNVRIVLLLLIVVAYSLTGID